MDVQKQPRTPRSTAGPAAVLTPALRRLLLLLVVLLSLIGANSLYLAGVDAAGAWSGRSLETEGYLYGFLLHLVLGLLIAPPLLWFAIAHLRRAWARPNRYAVAAGLALFLTLVAVLVSGVLLTRFEWIAIDDPRWRVPLYWAHALLPLAALWLFLLHRLAGPPLHRGATRAAAAAVLGGGAVALALHLVALPAPVA